MKLTGDKLRQLVREEADKMTFDKGRFYDQHGYQTYKKELEGTVVDEAEATSERLTFRTRLQRYTVYGDSVRLNGKRISGIASPFVERKREVKNITKRETKGKFGSTESLFIEVGSNMTFKVREPKKFRYSMDREG